MKKKKNKSRKNAYPIVLTPEEDGGYFVTIPDFGKSTQGDDIVDAMEMARYVIGYVGIGYEDDGVEIPKPYSVDFEVEHNDIQTLVDVDFEVYRRKVDNRSVKKNCTIPYWLNVEAEKAEINFSKLLQDAILETLGLNRFR